MRETISQAKHDHESYAGERPESDSGSKKKVDMNDLLARVRKEEADGKKINTMIFLGVALVLIVSLITLI